MAWDWQMFFVACSVGNACRRRSTDWHCQDQKGYAGAQTVTIVNSADMFLACYQLA